MTPRPSSPVPAAREPLFGSRNELVKAAQDWSSILTRGGAGWLMAPQRVPVILDELVVTVEALEEAVTAMCDLAHGWTRNMPDDERLQMILDIGTKALAPREGAGSDV